MGVSHDPLVSFQRILFNLLIRLLSKISQSQRIKCLRSSNRGCVKCFCCGLKAALRSRDSLRERLCPGRVQTRLLTNNVSIVGIVVAEQQTGSSGTKEKIYFQIQEPTASLSDVQKQVSGHFPSCFIFISSLNCVFCIYLFRLPGCTWQRNDHVDRSWTGR